MKVRATITIAGLQPGDIDDLPVDDHLISWIATGIMVPVDLPVRESRIANPDPWPVEDL